MLPTHVRGEMRTGRVRPQDLRTFTLSHPTSHVVIGIDVILGGLGPQVNHLVKAELAAVDGCCLGF